uniref:Uncharacterized protein n=1 Tax=Spongospora subterranea TaxID=70186 RepID=A0A0H5QFX0_9EUKA|eukprot:CRZ00953.1 hypothetical protein [Spongospora subterranea]
MVEIMDKAAEVLTGCQTARTVVVRWESPECSLVNSYFSLIVVYWLSDRLNIMSDEEITPQDINLMPARKAGGARVPAPYHRPARADDDQAVTPLASNTIEMREEEEPNLTLEQEQAQALRAERIRTQDEKGKMTMYSPGKHGFPFWIQQPRRHY